MKKSIIILLLALLAGCAKEPPFDPVEKFKDAEEKMQKFKYEEARKAYQEIQEKAPDRSYDADIMLRIADTYYGEEKYAEAQVEYQAFINFHPVHRDASYAQYQIGMCSYQELTTIDRDPSLTRAALKEFQNLLVKYPGNPYEEEAKKYIAVCRDTARRVRAVRRQVLLQEGVLPGRRRAVRKASEGLSRLDGGDRTPSTIRLSNQEQGNKAKAISDFETLAAKYPDWPKRPTA